MTKFSAVEWQSFSTNKDIEFIVKKLHKDNVIRFSLLYEISIVIIGAVITNIFNGINNYKCFWIILLILSIIPFLFLGAKWIYDEYKKNKPDAYIMDPKDFVDSFDNKIIYYALISESFYTMLFDALTCNDNGANVKKIPEDIINFYYIQTSYYFNKAIANLIPIHNIADKVLSLDSYKIKIGRIALPRYYNLKQLLNTIFKYLEKHKNIIKNLEEGDIIIKLNKEYMDNLDGIDRIISEYIKSLSKEEKI